MEYLIIKKKITFLKKKNTWKILLDGSTNEKLGNGACQWLDIVMFIIKISTKKN